jgi:cardiolipin synthase
MTAPWHVHLAAAAVSLKGAAAAAAPALQGAAASAAPAHDPGLFSPGGVDLLWIGALVVVIAHVAGIVLALDAVMRGRTAQGTVAWVVALLTIPLVSIVFYVVFGNRRFNGYVRARRKGTASLDVVARACVEAMRPYATPSSCVSLEGGARAAMERLAHTPWTRGNQATLLIDGAQTFEAIHAAIGSAREYVLVQFYILRDDATGRAFRQHLIDAAARGVRVHLMYDEVGCKHLRDSYLEPLRRAGCAVSGFRTTRGPGNRFQINFRNHRKIVICDGQCALLGGLNVGDEYMGLDPELGDYRDTHVRIDGPAALAAQLAWIEDWHWATRSVPAVRWETRAQRGDARMLVLPSGPADRFETCLLAFSHLIHSAQRRIWIASPYFVPDEGTIAALQLAALRGVDVRIVIPGVSDSRLVRLSMLTYLPDIIPAGIRVYRYTSGFMHHKVILSDSIACVGTANFDNRSFRINFEITAMCDGGPFADDVRAMLERDFERCQGVSESDFVRKPWLTRAACRVARLMSPIQ